MEKAWSAAVEAWAVKPVEGQFSDSEDEPKVNVANLEIKDANTFKASLGDQRGGHGGHGDRGGRDQSGGGRGCFKCGQEGHFSRECPNHSLAVAFSTKCLNCGRKGHFSRDCPNPICFKCGEEGHFAYKCPSKSQGSVFVRIPGKSSGEVVLDGDTKCSKCGEQDHLSRNCPKCAKCFRCQEKGDFKRDCPQVQAPLAGGNGLNSNGLAEIESPPILMNLMNGDGNGGRGGHGGPSDRSGHGSKGQEKGHFKIDSPQAQAPLAGGNGNCFDCNELTEMEMKAAPILMNLVNGDCSGGRGGHGGPSDRGGHQEKGQFKRDCPQPQTPPAGGNGNCFDSNELAETEMESASILMGHGDGSGGRGGQGAPSGRCGRGGRMSKFWAATSKYLETPQ